jgi:hypothetical protein
LLPEHPAIYGYTRSYEGKVWTVLLNFSNKEQGCAVGEKEIRMKGYETLILR